MTPESFELLTGRALVTTAYDCHGASLQLVKALRKLGPDIDIPNAENARVARGRARGVLSQHSWVVLGENCYDRRARLLDPTLWCYRKDAPYVWDGTLADDVHHPHGEGSIWSYGQPPEPEDAVIELDVDPGEDARIFLAFAAPRGLDRAGWHVLLHSPVGGWPARAIVDAVLETPRLANLVPVDIVGMVTDRNPGGMYW